MASIDRATWLQGPAVGCTGKTDPEGRAWRLILLGAPGIGKGTQATLLSERLHACQLSTGDVFRAAKKCSCDALSPAMQEAMGQMKRGELVSDATVIALVRERSKCLACTCGFLLDGYPRTVEQAEALEALMSELGVPLDAVLSFELDTAKVVQRLSGRRTCSGCARTFHVVHQPPRVEGVCDYCSAALIQREDDRPEAIKVRLDAYETLTAPLKDFYGRRGVLHVVSAEGAPTEVFARALASLGVE